MPPPRTRRNLSSPRRARVASVAASVVVALALAACSDEGPERTTGVAPSAPATGAATDVPGTAAPTTTAPTAQDAGPGDVVAECGEGTGPCAPSSTTPAADPDTELESTSDGPTEGAPSTSSTAAVEPADGTSGAAGGEAAVPAGAVPSLEGSVFWVRPYGEDRPLAIPGYDEPSDGSRPFVLFGAVRNTGADAIASPGLVVAFDGGSLGTASGAALVPGAAEPAARIEPGESLDVVVVVDDPVRGPQLAGAATTLWGVSR